MKMGKYGLLYRLLNMQRKTEQLYVSLPLNEENFRIWEQIIAYLFFL